MIQNLFFVYNVSFCLASIAEDPESKATFFDDRMMEGARVLFLSIVLPIIGKANTGPAVTADQPLEQIVCPERR